jgi:hypothetical protein
LKAFLNSSASHIFHPSEFCICIPYRTFLTVGGYIFIMMNDYTAVLIITICDFFSQINLATANSLTSNITIKWLALILGPGYKSQPAN